MGAFCICFFFGSTSHGGHGLLPSLGLCGHHRYCGHILCIVCLPFQRPRFMAAEMGVGATSLEEPEKSRSPRGQASPTTNHEREIDSASTLHEPLAQGNEALPIVYHYLTFETELPSAPFPAEHDALRQSPPPCPNLRNFQNPFLWSRTRKSFMTWLSCLITVSAAYSSGSYVATADQLTRKWGISNVAYNVGITLFTVGFGIAPMALAPLSEEYGRRPVFLVSGLLYVGKTIYGWQCSKHG
jgi:hypothetical protein